MWLWLACSSPDPADPPGDGGTPDEIDCASADPWLETATGCVHGSLAPSGRERFLGIPYAEPPIGERRLSPPAPIGPWSTPLDATRAGPACVQFADSTFGDLALGDGDEDCLRLNVWRPAGARGLPVLIFVHGGGHVAGSASEPFYADDPALAEDAVVVTVEHRLGPLGFLAHPALSAEDPDGSSGNYGLQDVLSALRWVDDNLGALGGDPERRILFGESAGGLEVCAALGSPMAAGLFDAAIVQSAPCIGIARPLREPPPLTVGGEAQGEAFAEQLGCAGDPEEIRACLRQAPIEALVSLGRSEIGPLTEGWRWQPWIDGAWLPLPLPEAMRSGEWNAVPVLASVNRDEGTIFTAGQAPTPEALGGWISTWAALLGVDRGALAARYAPEAYGGTEQAYAALFGDALFVCPTVWQQELLSGQVEARGAYWAHIGADPLGLGAFHASEIPYVFGTAGGLALASAEERALSERIRAAWRSMADPSPELEGLGSWPTVDRGWLTLEVGSTEAEPPPGAEACALFEGTWLDPRP